MTEPETLDAPRGSSRTRVWLSYAALVLVASLGAFVGWSLAPTTHATIGPVTAGVDVVMRPAGGVALELPPFGEVEFDTHRGPVGIAANVESVDADSAKTLISSPQALDDLAATAPSTLRSAVLRAGLVTALFTVAGAVIAVGAVVRRPRRVVEAITLVVVPLVAAGGIAATSFDPTASRQPRFTGLLSQAPYLAGQGEGMLARLQSYRSGVADMVSAVSVLYATSGELPVLPKDDDLVTVLHISDVHLNPQAYDLVERLIPQFSVDAVVDTGDVTTWGTEAESSTLARIGRLKVPYVFVRGNHDSVRTAAAVAAQPGATVLDSSVAEVAGLRFAGIGDATFSPDGTDPAQLSSEETAGKSAQALADVVTAQPDTEPVDVALIHNAAHVEALYGTVPLILSGHTHDRRREVDEDSGTLTMVEGSTGGAGITSGALSNLEQDSPAPLEATVLYFGRVDGQRPRLLAWDDVTVGGLGLSSVTVARTMADGRDPAASMPSPAPTAAAPRAASATGGARKPTP